MSATRWEIEKAGVRQTFAALSAYDLRRTLANQAADTVTFVLPAQGSQPYAVDDMLKIYRDGVLWFSGTLTDIKTELRGAGEVWAHTVKGPWYRLEQLVFQQPWTYHAGILYSSHLLLNLAAPNTAVSTIDQITAVLSWVNYAAQQRGENDVLQIGSILPGTALYAPIDEVRDMTCAEVIRRELRWHRDAVVYWDYTTDPPTIHILTRAAMQTHDLDIGTIGVDLLDVKPRHDIQLPAVVIRYERTSKIDGEDVMDFATDAAPSGATGLEEGALLATISLQGVQAQDVKATLATQPILAEDPDSQTQLNWWLDHLPAWKALYDAGRLTDLTIIGVETQPANNTLPNELTSGQIAPWMQKQSQTVSYTAKISGKIISESGQTYEEFSERRISVKLTATDATSGEYRALQSFQSADPLPIGVAQSLYDALSPLQYEGTLRIMQSEAGADQIIGRQLRVSGSGTALDGELSLIQSVSEAIDSGTTVIAFGPPSHLSPQDIIAALQLSRYRRRWTAPQTQADGSLANASVTLGQQTSKESVNDAPAERKLVRYGTDDTDQVIIDMRSQGSVRINGHPQVSGNGRIELDLAATAGKRMYIREAEVCVNGQTKRALVLMSDPY